MTEPSQEKEGEEKPLEAEGAEEGKPEELTRSLKEEREKAEEYLTRLKYLQADFENYQKRVKKELEEAVRFGNERLIVKLLDVMDNLERAVNMAKTEDKTALIDGVEITLKEMHEALRGEGLTEIEALGKPFNPSLHEAVASVDVENSPGNIVVEELRRGYLLNGRVVRPSMVKVAKPAKNKIKSKSNNFSEE